MYFISPRIRGIMQRVATRIRTEGFTVLQAVALDQTQPSRHCSLVVTRNSYFKSLVVTRNFVGIRRLELLLPCGNEALDLARLPISPYAYVYC